MEEKCINWGCCTHVEAQLRDSLATCVLVILASQGLFGLGTQWQFKPQETERVCSLQCKKHDKSQGLGLLQMPKNCILFCPDLSSAPPVSLTCVKNLLEDQDLSL